MIRNATLILPDTSTLNGLSADMASKNRQNCKRALRFIAETVNRAWILAVSFEHLVEIWQHADNTVIDQRVNLFRSIPTLAVVKPMQNDASIGSVLDIVAREVKCAVLDGVRDVVEIRNRVRKQSWASTTGEELHDVLKEVSPAMREVARSGVNRNRMLSSVSHIDVTGMGQQRLKNNDLQTHVSEEKIRSYRNKLKKNLVKSMEEKGVIGLEGVQEFGSAFANSVQRNLEKASRSGELSVDSVCQIIGLDRRLIHEGMTLDEIGYLGSWNHKLNVISKCLNLPSQLTAVDVLPRLIPSQVFERIISLVRQAGAHRAESGDLMDSHFCSLACYVDVAIVDKRTKEWSRQASQRDAVIRALSPRIRKLPRYTALLDSL